MGSEAVVCTLHLEEVGTGCLPGVLIYSLLSGHKVIVDGERVNRENNGESFMEFGSRVVGRRLSEGEDVDRL